VDLWVRAAVVSGVATFDDLLARLPGVYPSMAIETVRRLALAEPGLLPILTRILQPAGNHRNHDQELHEIDLPTPHPLDYDWRFADQTVNQLLAQCEDVTTVGETVALLGVPTVLRAAHENSCERQMVLLDACGTTVDLLAPVTGGRALKCDLLIDPLPQIAASAVISDPPWYIEEMRAFLWAAARVCRVGGHVLMSVPPVGTRPTIESERRELFAWSEELGLKLLRLESSSLIYQSPLFEANAFKVEGIPRVSHNWRRGDLAWFSLETKVDVPRPTHSSSIHCWVEECVDGIRWRIRREENCAFDDPRLISIVPGDVLPSVSRRDARRMHVDVWTSGNRVFRTAAKQTLQLILCALRYGRDPKSFVESKSGRRLTGKEVSLIRIAVEQIKEIAEIERNENLSFKGKITND
jgi:hypothetical protein